MTNAQIIGSYMEENGITEPIHTFSAWKKMGFSVKKGEHAMAQIMIWKYNEKKGKNVSEEASDEEKMAGYCFLKNSHFFGLSQVQPMRKEVV